MNHPSESATVASNLSTYRAVRVYGSFCPRCHIYKNDELYASMTKSIWLCAGEIAVAEGSYRIDRRSMQGPGGKTLATYSISHPFLHLSPIELLDAETQRTFQMQTKRSWSNTVVLMETGSTVAEITSSVFQSRSKITFERTTPELIILLAAWLDIVVGVFND